LNRFNRLDKLGSPLAKVPPYFISSGENVYGAPARATVVFGPWPDKGDEKMACNDTNETVPWESLFNGFIS